MTLVSNRRAFPSTHESCMLFRVFCLVCGMVVAVAEVPVRADEQPEETKNLDYWLTRLQSEDAFVRQNAIYHIGQEHSQAVQAVPALIRCLQDPKANVRAEAADSLGEIGSRASQATQPLIECLQNDKEPLVKAACALALASTGGRIEKRVAALSQAVRKGEPIVRARAAYALGRMRSRARAAVPSLVAALKDEADSVRINARRALERIDPDALRRAEKK